MKKLNSFDFIGKAKIWFIIAIVTVVAGMAVLGFVGFNGSDRTGNEVQISVDQNFGDNKSKISAEADKYFSEKGFRVIEMAEYNDDALLVYTLGSAVTDEQALELNELLKGVIEGTAEVETKAFSTQTYGDSSEILWAIFAVAVALVVIFLYLLIVNKLACAATVVFVGIIEVLMFVALAALFRLIATQSLFVTALLSLAMTLVLSGILTDSAKEELKIADGRSFSQIANSAVNYNFFRFILFFAVVFATCVILVIVGTAPLKIFASQLFVAGLTSVFASLCLTGNLWAWLKGVNKKSVGYQAAEQSK